MSLPKNYSHPAIWRLTAKSGKWLGHFLIATGMALIVPNASAQDYPNKPIKMVIPYTPGGSIDTVGRLIADQLQRQLGQPVVIENLPGASGLLGSLNVKKGNPDGYTLLFNASSQVYLPLVVAKRPMTPKKTLRLLGKSALCR